MEHNQLFGRARMANKPTLRDDQHLLDLEPLTEEQSSHDNGTHVTRRTFLSGLGAAGVLAGTAPLSSIAAPSPSATQDAPPVVSAVTINGKSYELAGLDPRVSLLDLLRERLYLTGTKKGCDHGQCGACTVHVNGRRVNSCLTLAVMTAGKEVTTIEGIGQPGNLHPMQAAFVEHDGYQCGYCTSGQIMSAVALLKEPVGASEDEVKQAMSGNICRCGAYPNILTAVQQVRAQQGHGQQLRS
jgi:xanthine dehydrogenase YagT iron-sulfur-binding subunit